MVIQMTPQECAARGSALARAARQNPAKPVTYYPGWSVADLVAHTDLVQRWVLGIARSRATEGGPLKEYEDRDPMRLLAWFEEGLEALSRELEGADSNESVWSFDDQTVGFWQRRSHPPLGRAEWVRRPSADRVPSCRHRDTREPSHPRRPTHAQNRGGRARRVRCAPLRRWPRRLARGAAPR
jgi:hypothetical protein